MMRAPILLAAAIALLTLVVSAGEGLAQPSGLTLPTRRPDLVPVGLPGSIYVADTGHNQIVRIDNMLGGGLQILKPTGAHAFNRPSGLIAWQGPGLHLPRDLSAYRLYIVDQGNNRLVRVDNMGGGNWAFFGSAGSGAGRFQKPSRVAAGNGVVDGNSGLSITDVMNGRIVTIADISGANWHKLDFGRDVWAGLNIAGANNYCSEKPGVGAGTTGMGIAIHRGQTFIAAAQWAVRIDPLPATQQVDACTDNQGHRWGPWHYLADLCCSRPDGNSLFSSPAGGGFIASDPQGLAIDAAGHIYVADTGNNRIVRFDNMTGGGWTELKANPSNPADTFKNPSAIALDAAGGIFVADTANNRIVRVDNIAGGGWKTCCTMPGGQNVFAGPQDIYVGPGPH